MIPESIELALSDACNLLESRQFPFAVIGGLCVLVHGEMRMTEGVDLVIAAEPDEAVTLLDSLNESEFQPLLGEEAAEFARQAYMLPLHHTPTGITVDVAIGSMGFERQVIHRASTTEFGTLNVPVATAEDLILMKLVAGRARDLEDIENVVLAQADLDWDYLATTGAALQTALSQDLVPLIERLKSRS